jgi:hypothetical protein
MLNPLARVEFCQGEFGVCGGEAEVSHFKEVKFFSYLNLTRPSKTFIYEYICYVEESRAPLWPSGQSSWLQNGDVLYFL